MKIHNTTGARIPEALARPARDIGNALGATHLWWMPPRQGAAEAVIRIRPQKYVVLNLWSGAELLASIWSSGEEEGPISKDGPDELYKDHEVALPKDASARAIARAIKAQSTDPKRVAEAPARSPSKGPFFVTLSAEPNTDFGRGSHQASVRIAPRKQRVASLADASKAVEHFIQDHELGGGNWTGGLITDASGKEIGRVSYNGRVWSLDERTLLWDRGTGAASARRSTGRGKK